MALENANTQSNPALGKASFANLLIGPRLQLARSGPAFTDKVWQYLLRDRQCGGANYAWINSVDDVGKYITAEEGPEPAEIDYLIIKNDDVIGSFHVHKISHSNRQAEIGYAIEKGEQGKGYISESLQLVLAEMKRIGFQRAVIQCDKENIRSIRVAERNGFTFEERRLQDSIKKIGSRDVVIFSKILDWDES